MTEGHEEGETYSLINMSGHSKTIGSQDGGCSGPQMILRPAPVPYSFRLSVGANKHETTYVLTMPDADVDLQLGLYSGSMFPAIVPPPDAPVEWALTAATPG